MFALWLFFRPEYHPKSTLDLGTLFPSRDFPDIPNPDKLFQFLIHSCTVAGVKISQVGLKLDEKNCTRIGLPVSMLDLSQPKTKEAEIIVKTSNTLIRGEITAEEFITIGNYCPNIYKYVYIRPTFTADDVKKLSDYLDKYIDLFLTNSLLVNDINCLIFEQQKQELIHRVRSAHMIEKFGHNFIIDSKRKHASKDYTEGYLFVHALYALQRLDYISVLKLKNRGCDFKPYASIIALEPLLAEVNSSFREENPTTIYEGLTHGGFILKFAGKEIELSKKKKETDAVLLMKTLNKEPSRAWFEDEILEDWDALAVDNTAQNKCYAAARKVNNFIREKTQIDDFLDHNTNKFQINPKYLKVDE